MHRLLIANRGEVALRIARSAREMGIAACGVFARDEAGAPYLAALDSRAALPGTGPAAFLDSAALVGAALHLGADALHPGWGFLSESPVLAEACAQAGIPFVGPTIAQLALCGDKRQARAWASACDVKVAESADREGAEALLASGAVMLKATAGGGGRGMRVVREAASLAKAWADASAEAEKFFGDGTIFAEQLITGARHVEVQIAGDGRDAVSLGTRDCTLQRRNQKLVETAPAPNAAELEDAALRMARQAGYLGLGTWEFLQRGEGFFFLEVNPRLQVEHTVTEAVTGLDLVQLQLRLAAGDTLAALGLLAPPAPRGFAMQMRINAEILSADGSVRPASGRLSQFHPPGGPFVRVDHATEEGAEIGVNYDSLLAKLIVHGPDRAATLRRAARALAEFQIDGVATSLPTLRRLLALPAVQNDDLHTGFVETVLAEIVQPAAEAPPADAAIVTAPMPGTLVQLDVVSGDAVRAGQRVALVEAMKMQMEVTAATAGTVLLIEASVGDTLREGQAVLVLQPADHGVHEAEAELRDPGHVRADLAAAQARILATLDEGRPDAVARRHNAGKRTARENLDDLYDAGSFTEYGGLALAAQRRRRSVEELIRVSPADGLVCGIGTVAQRPTAAMAYDYTVMAGTQGFLNHKKTDRLLNLLHREPAPLVLFAEGGGGRPGDTDVMGVAGLDLSTFAAFAALSGKTPLLGIAAGNCFAGNAALLGCCDAVIATADSSIGMGGPAMIEGGGLGVFRPEAVGPSTVQAPNGVIDLLVSNETEAVLQAKRYLGYFAGTSTNATCTDQRQLRHTVPEDRKRIYDMRALIKLLADSDSVLELRAAFGTGIITALIRIDGAPFGLIASNPAHLGGAIDAPAADKAARFMQLCDAHGLPILSLCDTPGFMVGPETERTAQVRHVCRMFVIGASLTVPVFCVVTRKGYGLGAIAMAAGGFHQTRFTIAWPSGEFGGMGLEGAVRLGYRSELEAQQNPAARQALFEKLVARLYEEGKAINMASYLEIDAVIDPADTRRWITNALRAAPARKGGRFVDTW